jgi:hypothetical protein
MQILDLPDETLFDILNFAADYRPIIAVVCRRWNDVISGRTNTGRNIPLFKEIKHWLKRIQIYGNFLNIYCDYIDFEDNYFGNTINDKVTISWLLHDRNFNLIKRIVQTFKKNICDINKGEIPILPLRRIYINMARQSKSHYNNLYKNNLDRKMNEFNSYLIGRYIRRIIRQIGSSVVIEWFDFEFKNLYMYITDQSIYYHKENYYFSHYLFNGDEEILDIYFNNILINEEYKRIFDINNSLSKGLLILYECSYNTFENYKKFVSEEDPNINKENYIILIKKAFDLAVKYNPIEYYIRFCRNKSEEKFVMIMNFLKKFIFDENKFYNTNFSKKIKRLMRGRLHTSSVLIGQK